MLLRTSAVAATAAAGLLMTPAHAAAAPSDFADNARIDVRRVALLNHDGSVVRHQVRFRCPAGEPYTLTSVVTTLEGEDAGVVARRTSTGTCTGRRQVVRQRLLASVSGVLQPGPAVAFSELRGEDFYAQYCVAGSCADTTHPYRVTLR